MRASAAGALLLPIARSMRAAPTPVRRDSQVPVALQSCRTLLPPRRLAYRRANDIDRRPRLRTTACGRRIPGARRTGTPAWDPPAAVTTDGLRDDERRSRACSVH